jgi:hypothetical protein
MAKDKNVELQRKQIYLANTIIRKQARKDKRKSSWRMKYKECPDCGGQMVCCYEYGTCPCS